MVDDGDVKAEAARKLGVPAERVHVVRVADSRTGKLGRIVIVVEAEEKPNALAFSPDGKALAIEIRDDVETSKPLVAPLVLDWNSDGGKGPNTPRVLLSADKNAKWADVHKGIIRLQADGKHVLAGDSVWMTLLAAGPDGQDLKVQGPALNPEYHSPQGFRVGRDEPGTQWAQELTFLLGESESDVEFLKRVIKDVRGGTPTALEQKYFGEDKDPKKRDKLLDALLKDPAIARKVGDDWKKKMLAIPAAPAAQTWKYLTIPDDPTKKEGGSFKVVPAAPKKGELSFNFQIDPAKKEGGSFKVVPTAPKKGELSFNFQIDPAKKEGGSFKVVPAAPKKGELSFNFQIDPSSGRVGPAVLKPPSPPKPPVPPQPPKVVAPRADRLGRIVGELLAAGKSDADVLDGITLVVLGRLPTDAEKRLTLGLVAKAADRKAAWLEVAKALAATGEGKQRLGCERTKGGARVEGSWRHRRPGRHAGASLHHGWQARVQVRQA